MMTTIKSEPYEIPADIIAALESAPDAFDRVKMETKVDTVWKRYPNKSIRAIAAACHCSQGYAGKRRDILRERGEIE